MKLISFLPHALLLSSLLVTAKASLFRHHGSTLQHEDSPAVRTEDEHVLTNLDTSTNERPNELVGRDNPVGDTPPRGPGDLHSGLGCSVQCITSGIAYARGVNAELRVTSDTSAEILIAISGPTGLIGPFFSGAGQKSFSQHFLGLEPGTTYLGITAATDADGNTAYAQGHFTTLVRNVEIIMDPAIITFKDVENVYYSKQVWVNGAWVPSEQADVLWALPLNTGGWYLFFGQPGHDDTVALNNLDRDLEFIVQLYMVNRDRGDPVEVFGPLTEPGVGSQDGAGTYFGFVELEEGVFDLDDRPADATSWVEHQYRRELVRPWLTDPHVLYFYYSIWADISVRYEPA